MTQEIHFLSAPLNAHCVQLSLAYPVWETQFPNIEPKEEQQEIWKMCPEK